MSRAQKRLRNVCAECSRRKIACSKTFPCDQCTKKGIGETCSLEGGPERRASGSSADNLHQPQHEPRSLGTIGETSSNAQCSALAGRRASTTPQGAKKSEPPLQGPVPTGSDPGVENDAEIEDAATILEFLAWGRSKKPSYEDVPTTEADVVWHDEVETAEDLATDPTRLDSCENVSPLLAMRMLLPGRLQVLRLVGYHLDCLLWYHGSLHGGTFKRQLDEFYDKHDGLIDDPGVNLQWVALLFSVLVGTMTSASPRVLEDLGYRPAEQDQLSKRWIRAGINCLNLSDYTGRHSIFSVQAIATLTMSAHLLGFSNQQSVLLASANRIAQSLGLHRIASNQEKSTVTQESGRRVWAQLCQQDWFSIPFSECYSINRLCTTSSRPRNCDDETLDPLPESQPTITSYCRWLHSIASLMPQLQDDLMSSNTPFTAYEQVLRYDKKMRTLATTQRPAFLASGPVDPSWPCYVPWARQAAAMSSSHKIIMIHRKFLASSFTNPFFKFTRATSIAASKTILKVHREVLNGDGPTLWIHHAHAVAACVTLCLDIRHRPRDDPDRAAHHDLVKEAIELLGASPKSAIARRGTRLLTTLLAEDTQHTEQNITNSRKRRSKDFGEPAPHAKRQKSFDITSFVQNLRYADILELNVSPSTQSSNADVVPESLEQSLPVPAEHLYDTSAQKNSAPAYLGQPHATAMYGNTNDPYFDHNGQSFMGSVNTFEDLLFLASSYNFT